MKQYKHRCNNESANVTKKVFPTDQSFYILVFMLKLNVSKIKYATTCVRNDNDVISSISKCFFQCYYSLISINVDLCRKQYKHRWNSESANLT